MLLRTRAPAKINLTLHVVRRRHDGFHDLESLVAFAGVADILELDPDRPLGLDVEGPTAAAAGTLGENLVLKATRALLAEVPDLRTGAFRLIKRLPVGAGIGGGSSDAAAGLRLLAKLNGLSLDDPRVRAAARATGSDVPVCVEPRARMMRGTGDRLDHAAARRTLSAVLVNPGIHLETASVFSRMGLGRGQETALMRHPDIDRTLDHDAFLVALNAARNDMQPAAEELADIIAPLVAALAGLPGSKLARMSGSGSTCFALFEHRRAARAAAAAMRARHPDWWIRATPLM